MSKENEVQISRAFKGELVRSVRRAMKQQGLSQSELARRMRTSRAVVHRLLKRDDDTSLTLATISKAAAALGRTVRVRMQAVAA